MRRGEGARGRNDAAAERREYTRAAYGGDYLENLRWRYRRTYGSGTDMDPYRTGGSIGRGYQRATDLGARDADPGPRPRRDYAAPYYGRHPGGYRDRSRRDGRRPGTAARDAGYPYFSSAAITEAVQGYPPADTLNPEVYPPALGWGIGDYGDEYEPPGVDRERWRRGARVRSHERGESYGRGVGRTRGRVRSRAGAHGEGRVRGGNYGRGDDYGREYRGRGRRR